MEEAQVVNDDKPAKPAVNPEVENLQKQLVELNNNYLSLQKAHNDVLNMFRFTLGIAYQARPDSKQLQSMVDIIFKVENGD